ncbi:Potassium channel subfamily T member 1, partial [Fragariocoptes setiger]
MSNLWFFRLRSNEREREEARRRSSSDSRHSLGSMSLCAGLPSSMMGGGTGARSPSIGSANSGMLGAQQRYSRTGSQVSIAADQSDTPSTPVANDRRDDDHSNELRARCSRGTRVFPPRQMSVDVATSAASLNANQYRRMSRHLLPLHQQQQTQQHQQQPVPTRPLVTIVRSDSTSAMPVDLSTSLISESQTSDFGHCLVPQSERTLANVRVLDDRATTKQQLPADITNNGRSLKSSSPSSNRNNNNNLSNKFSAHLSQLASGQVPPIKDRSLLSPECGVNLADSLDNLAALIPRVRVEFYNSENTFKEQLQMYFFKDHTISLYIRIVKFVLKILACLLYVIRVVFDQGPAVAS